MKFSKFISLVLALLSLTPLLFVSCKNEEDNPLVGSTYKGTSVDGRAVWTVEVEDDTNMILTLTRGDKSLSAKGTYTISGFTVTVTLESGTLAEYANTKVFSCTTTDNWETFTADSDTFNFEHNGTDTLTFYRQ